MNTTIIIIGLTVYVALVTGFLCVLSFGRRMDEDCNEDHEIARRTSES